MTKTSNKPKFARPRRKHIRLPQADYQIQGTWYFVTICCRDKKPHMKKRAVRDALQEILQEVATSCQVEIAAYSILPNHLHLICSAGDEGLVTFLRVFKSKAARKIRKLRNPAFEWQKSFFDHRIRHDKSLDEKARYILENPVRLGLCNKAEEYPWNGSTLTQ